MTKKEKEILADIRNKYTPVLTFFELWDQIINNTTLTEQQRQDLYSMINREQGLASENAIKVAELLKSFG
jgi:hypothetical protein